MGPQIREGKTCPHCLQPTTFVDSATVYGTSFGMIYLCKPCKAYVGVYEGTDKALGTVANRDTRISRTIAHDALEELIAMKVQKGYSNEQAKQAAYQWLAEQMNLPEEDCRFSLMDASQCAKATGICTKVLDKIKRKL